MNKACFALLFSFLFSAVCSCAFALREEDFQVGYLYRTPEGTYYSEEAFDYNIEHYTIAGLDYKSTKERFPGGIDYFYPDDPHIFEGLIAVVPGSFGTEETFPLFTYWPLSDGRTFLIFWERDMMKAIAPFWVGAIDTIPDISEMEALQAGHYSPEELRARNPLLFSGVHHLSSLPYGYKYSLWKNGDSFQIYVHLFDFSDPKAHVSILHWRALFAELRLKGLLTKVAEEFL